jgi:hypothetical protein
MRRRIPCRTFRSWNATRRVASIGQREVQIQADCGRAAWRAETMQILCDFSAADGFRRDAHIDIRREVQRQTRCWVVDCKQPSGTVKPRTFTIPLYRSCLASWDSASLMPLNKSEWHIITRPEALAARAASRFPAQVAAQRPSDVTKGAAPSTSRAAGASVTSAHAHLSPGET